MTVEMENITAHYDNLRPVSTGAYSEVLVAEEVKTGEKVALKVSAVDERRKREIFKREVDILKYLQHPLICQLKSSFMLKKKGRKFGVLVLEKMETDLLEYTMARGRLPEDEVKKIFLRICEGVHHCHNHGIAHLDLKPDNILLSLDRTMKVKEAKLCDFGLSRKWDLRKSPTSMIFPGESIGTHEYLAPELKNVSKPKEFSLVKADSFSLGLILFTMLTGALPIINQKGVPDSKSIKTVLQYTEGRKAYRLIRKLLRKRPSKRPSVEEIFLDEWFF